MMGLDLEQVLVPKVYKHQEAGHLDRECLGDLIYIQYSGTKIVKSS